MDDNLTAIDPNQLSKDASGAYQFISTNYGERYLSRITALHFNLHEQAEQEGLTSEHRAYLVSKASGIKQCIDMITKEAQLISSGELDRIENEAKLGRNTAEVDPSIVP